MKNLKKISALFVALVMTMFTVVPVFAEGQATSPRANIIVNENMSGRDLKAYQIFKATEVTPTSQGQWNIIKNVSWGNNMPEANRSSFITELNKIEGITLASDATSNEVAKAIEAVGNDSAKAIQVAKAALATKAGEGIPLQSGSNEVTLGYYLIVDETNISDLNPGQAINPAILLVNGDVTVKKKNQDVTVDKSVKNETDTTFGDATESSIGKTVTFRYVAPVIDKEALAQYKTYQYQFEDTLSQGVDVDTISETDKRVKFNAYLVDVPNASSIPVTLAESSAAKNITPKFSSTIVENQKFTITCDDLKTLTETSDEAAGKFIVIEYTGKLNEKAVIGGTGNLNTVTLKYSNNPNHSDSGDPVQGETDPSTAIVFTFGYDGTKVDIATPEDVLAGAKFVVSRSNGASKEYALFDTSDDTTDESAVRKIKQWTTIEEFDDSLVAYKKSLELKEGESLSPFEQALVDNFKQFVITSDENGKFGANGLGDGTYFLNEIIQPKGYVRPNNEFEFTISSKVTNTDGIGSVTELKIDDITMQTPSTGLVTGTIENSSTVNLPETGGMGTTMLYIAGGILLVGSAVLLVTKKRMGHEG